MRTISTVAAAALACLVVGTTVAGCSDGTTAEELSAEQMLDNANDAMKALKSVTIDSDVTATAGADFSNRLTTDLKGRCANKRAWDTGAVLEQIRIGEADYVRPNRTYLERAGKDVAGTKEQKRWVKTLVDEADVESGLSDCTWPFASFGTARKGEPTKVNGSPAIPLVVTDKADKENKGGTYTFYVATEGKPYLLKVVYKGIDYRSTTTFSAFDKPLDVRPPAKTDVLDASGIGR
jgi:hypothetical protein